MVSPELVSYIWSRRKEGMSDVIIKANLRTQGWTNEDFDEAAATLPPPNTKIDGTLIQKLGPNVVWTGQEEHKSRRRRIPWKFMAWAIAVGLVSGLIVWLVTHPEMVKGLLISLRTLFESLLQETQKFIRKFK